MTEYSDSYQLAQAIAVADFSDCYATVVGYGPMGVEYVKALRRLGVAEIRVCSRTAERLAPLRADGDIETVVGDIEDLSFEARTGELGIIACPPQLLIAAAERLVALGFRRLLVEKPVSLWSDEIRDFTGVVERAGVEVFCAFNRTAYPAFYEVMSRAAGEGGITSCTYEFTEIINPDWPERFPAGELARWGVSNSLHVMSMAHGLIGLPVEWSARRTEANKISWHPSGSVFVGSGITDGDIPFAYHANWGSKGRWAIEVHTDVAAYRLCPMETVQRRSAPLADWEEVPLTVAAEDVKAGILEQIALVAGPLVVPYRGWDPASATRITAFGEDIFAYASGPGMPR
jgi:predicted dehydrogenase